MKLALVHEWLNVYGGSERLLAEILGLHPQAQLHALIHNKENLCGTLLEGVDVKTSFLQKIPRVEHLYRGLLPLMPFAIESMNVRDYDVVLSVSHAVAHGVKTTKEQVHISYVCTPMRYAWHLQDDYLHLHHLNKPIIGAAARVTLGLLRRWDRAAAARADHLLAISQWTAERIKQAWECEAKVIYPPVDVDRFNPAKERDNFYLLVSRLVPYKMTAEIIRAFNQLKLPLIIVGDGPEMPRLQKLANENIKLLGHQPDSAVADLMKRAKAFVYMAVEDFGIAMVEAQAAGCPVIAYARGGAVEIVQEGETGLLYREQTAGSMMEAVSQFERRPRAMSPQAARENTMRFSSQRFQTEFTDFVESSKR
ncbi:MAG: glycosyltransferase [Chloroflexi bacterium]|nr:glycosyltransferase [Chloroflexota bacterium]